MSSHLIIGLGGTGGKIIRALRKTIYQEFRSNDPEGVQLGYLYVDSSPEMMELDDPNWKILGTSVQLGKDSQLSIKASDLSSRLDNIDNYPGIKPWIGSREQWNDILRTFSGSAVLGGQKRRLGRFLFACNAAEFVRKLRLQVSYLEQQLSKQVGVTFHVCAGLAGGTGSGSVIDVLAQIRKAFPYEASDGTAPDKYRVLLYVLLPDTNPLPNWDTGNYHSNGYAALVELNALSVGKLEPHDVSGTGERLKVGHPFNGCYAFTNENEQAVTVNISSELPGIVADFLYHKIVAIRSAPWDALRRAENGENGDSTPETLPIPGSKEGAREKKFLTFGIKRIAIPEEEIGEYLTYSFSRQVTLQLLYNNWSPTAGFLGERTHQPFREFVERKETHAQWKLSNEHLSLSLGILPEEMSDKKWKPINTDWETVIPHFKTDVRSGQKEVWLDELAKLCQKRFEHDYRGLGVANFYKTKKGDTKEEAAEIRRTIDEALFNDWMNGAEGRSLHDIGQLLGVLITSLEERLKGLPDRVEKIRGNEKEASAKVQENGREWAKVGILSAALGKLDKLLDAQAICLQNLYTHRTWIEALGFAQLLLREVLVEVNDLKTEVDRAASMTSEELKSFENAVAERCADEGKGEIDERQMGKQLIRFYDPELVKSVSRSFIVNEQEQRAQISRVRKELVAKVGEHLAFSRFNQRVDKATFHACLESECEANARVAHNNLITDGRKKLLGVSIIEKLRDRYEGEPQKLKEFAYDVVKHSCNYLTFDSLEVDKAGPGIPSVPARIPNFAVTLPKAPEQAKFVASLKEAFRASRDSSIEFLEREGKPNEITLTSVTNLFPLRFVKQVGFLRQKYDAKLKGPDVERAKLELHVEGDGSNYPSLFVPSSEEIKKEGIPFLLLAKTMNLIKILENPATGSRQLAISKKDADGWDAQPIYLGKTFVESFEKLDLANLSEIGDQVRSLLNGSEYSHEEKIAQLRKGIRDEVEAIKAERNNNMEDPLYKRFLEGGKAADRFLKERLNA